jgi:type I restriction enzyme R subunit
LRQGIEDGFLAPYRVHRIVTEWDAAGWRPSKEERDRYGREIPDDEYQTKDFERVIALRARTEAIAQNLVDFMTKTDRFAKTIVFCVDQEHASEMRQALHNLNSDLTGQYPDYVCRVTSDEGDIGKGQLSRFQDVDTKTPTILTTSQLLTTGVDAPTCKNIVLARVIGSMTEFKQIIGRGTRVRDDYGKLWFNILDYAGSATQKFADKDFDGDPVWISESPIDGPPPALPPEEQVSPEYGADAPGEDWMVHEPNEDELRKFYFDGGHVAIAAHLVYELDPQGKQLRTVRYTDYAGEKVRDLVSSSHALRDTWTNLTKRGQLIEQLEERGISFADLADQIGRPEADPFDLLCHLAFNAPLRTRRERAQRLRAERKDLFEKYGPEARQILDELLEKYAEHGDAQFKLPDALHIPPINEHGNPAEIIQLFGGVEELRHAVNELQSQLYVAES